MSEYTVTFRDWDHTQLKVETVPEGEDATPPTEPTRDNYVFVGWDTDFTEVSEDLTVTAKYEFDVNYSLTREVLYEYLTKACTTITRWHQPFFDWEDAAKLMGLEHIGDLEKPYGVIVLGDESQAPEATFGFHIPVEVWPYFKPGNYIPLDEAIKELGYLLNSKLIAVDGKYYMMEYISSGRDFHDRELRAITKRMDFNMPRVRL